MQKEHTLVHSFVLELTTLLYWIILVHQAVNIARTNEEGIAKR